MTRHITAHKGWRTARAPEARIRPQTLERIRATMQQREMSFADLIEEKWGSNDEAAASRANGKRGGRPKKSQGGKEMAEYNVYENEKLIETVEAKSAQAAIKKVEKSHGSLFNPFAVNSQDANDNCGEAIDQRHGHSD